MSDDLNPDARQLVDLARQARTPGDADKRRIAERLAVPLAAGAAVGGATAAAKAAGAQAAGASLFASWGVKLATLVVVGATATALVVSRGSSSSGSRATKPAPMSAPSPAPQVAPTPPVAEPAPVSPDALPEQAAQPVAPPRSVAAVAPHVPKADELMEEAALLHQAQSAWRAGQIAKALELANQHARRFPRSQLANERDVLRVLSLCKLGQTASAKQVGARLLRSAKGSPWYQSVAASCAAD